MIRKNTDETELPSQPINCMSWRGEKRMYLMEWPSGKMMKREKRLKIMRRKGEQ